MTDLKQVYNDLAKKSGLRMALGVGNKNTDYCEDYDRFRNYDVVMTTDAGATDHTCTSPLCLPLDFNSIHIIGMANLLRGKFSEIIFDWSVSKFYSGIMSRYLLDLLEDDGILIIDCTIYMRALVSKAEMEHIKSTQMDTARYITYSQIYMDNGPHQYPMLEDLVEHNKRHFEKVGGSVEVVKGPYPIAENKRYIDETADVTYLIVKKNHTCVSPSSLPTRFLRDA